MTVQAQRTSLLTVGIMDLMEHRALIGAIKAAVNLWLGGRKEEGKGPDWWISVAVTLVSWLQFCGACHWAPTWGSTRRCR